MRKTQRTWVEEQLLANGEVSRNQCLQQFISRLGAIICDLKAEGWDITPSRRNGDYVYTLVSTPKRKRIVCDIVNGVAKPRIIEVAYGN